MTNDDIFEWVPTIRVGPVHFGDEIKKHFGNLPLRRCATVFDEDGHSCYRYGDEEEPTYYADEEGRVNDVVCFDGLIYNGTDLIGLPIDRVIEHLGVAPDEYGEPVKMDLDEDDVQITAEFESLGLQLWLRDNIAVSAVVSVANVDDDEVQD